MQKSQQSKIFLTSLEQVEIASCLVIKLYIFLFFVGVRGEINTASLGFKRNFGILSFLSETISWQRADACLWEQKFDLRTSQKLCRSSWKRMKKPQNCFMGKRFKHKTAVSPLSEADERHRFIKSAGTVPTCVNTNTLDSYREQSGSHFGCFAGKCFCSPQGSRRHEPMPRWPRPLQVWQ